MKKILVCMTGMSPQVVTETIYALARRPVPFFPDEIRLVTTLEGWDLACKNLLDAERGHLLRLVRDLSLSLKPESVSLVRLCRRSGDPLADIRTVEDNEDAADGIMTLVREITADPNKELHLSLAGGRKTMGFYAGYAFSLFSRPQDRLSHIMVSPSFEFAPDFYYPALRRGETFIRTQSGELLDAATAEVTLSEIPIVRLRHALPPSLLHGEIGFSESVRIAQQAFRFPELVIDLGSRKIRVGGRTITLPPTQLAFLVWFARRKIAGAEALRPPKCDLRNPVLGQEYLAVYQEIVGPMGGADRTIAGLRKGMELAFFEQTQSKLHKRLIAALGEEGARPYRITGSGSQGKTYALSTPAETISFAPL